MKKTIEVCNVCMSEVEIDEELQEQKCPVCGKPIFPCTYCFEQGIECGFTWTKNDRSEGKCQFSEVH